MTAQSAVLNNSENVINLRENIQEDIKHYQDTLSYASSEVDYSMGENIYMLPSDMNLKIKTGTVGYNNKILVSDRKFSLGRNDKVNSLVLGPMGPTSGEPVIPMPKVVAQQTHAHELSQKPTHKGEKIAFVLFWQVVLSYGIFFNKKRQNPCQDAQFSRFATWDFSLAG